MFPHLDKYTPFEDNVTDVLAEDQAHQVIFGADMQVSALPVRITGVTTSASLTDTGATFISSGVVVGDVVFNDTDSSYGIVKQVVSETQLVTTPLKGGTNNSWSLGDTYSVKTAPYQRILLTQDDGLNSKGVYIRSTDNTEWLSVTNGTLTSLQFDITKDNPAHVEGKVFYDKDKHSLSYYNEEAEVTVNLGQEILIRVKNTTGATLTNGTVVYPAGFDGTDILIGKADASDKAKCRLIGVVTHDIEDGTNGYVTKIGEVSDIDTSAFVSGDIIYLSPTTPGALTKTRPTGGAFVTQVGSVKVSGASGSIVVDINTSEQSVEVTQDVGFSQVDNASISTVDSPTGCTVTLTPIGTGYCFYQYGDKYCKTTDSLVLPDEEGLFAVYYNLGALTYVKNPTMAQIEVVIQNNPTVTYVYWNATDKKSEYVGAELHGIGMSSTTHTYLHFNFGARYSNGLALNTISADASGNLTTSAQFGVDSGSIVDEDLYHAFPGVNSTTGLTIAYLSGTTANPTLRTTTNAGFSILTAGTGRMAFNTISGGNYVLSEVTNTNFALCHLFAINENTPAKRVIAFVGQAQYTSVANARAGAQTEIRTLKTVGILPQEVKAIGTVIFETNNTYTNAVKSRIRTVSTGVNYVDWRTTYFNGTSVGGAGGTGSTVFNDSLFRIINNVDSTKAIAFDASTIATGQTRTITMPDANVNLGDIGKVGTKSVTETAIGDDKILVYKAGSGKLEYEAKPSGGGGATPIRITIPGELTADSSYSQGLFWYNNTGSTITISNVAFVVSKAAAGTGASCAFNVYKSSGTASDGIDTSAVALFTSAVDLTTNYSDLTNAPDTTTVENGRWVSVRITASAGATNLASNAQIIITYS